MRPLGITLVGYYQVLRALVGLVFGFFILLFKGPANKLASVSADGNTVEQLVGRFGHAAGLVVIVFAAVHLISGYGVLKMQNWGRFLTLLFSAIELVLVLPSAIHANIFSLLVAVLNALCILYLALPPVARTFYAQGNPMRMVA
jgi:hypothetical protein